MPVHEGQRWLGHTLASLAVQDCSGVEILILDSSSAPTCAAIAQDYAERLTIAYEHCPDIPSWTRKTNIAAERASAPHLAMLHQDDLWLSGRIAAVHAAIDDDPDVGMWLSPARIVDRGGTSLGLWKCPLRDGRVSSAMLLERLLVQNFVAIPAPVFSREAWCAAGGLDEALWYTPDWDLYLKIARSFPVAYSSKPTTAFRIHAGSLTVTGSRDIADFAEQLSIVLARHIDALPPRRRAAVLKTAKASAQVNRSLATAAATGAKLELLRAGMAIFRLTPAQALRFWRDTRLVERVWPRVRARFAGAF